MHLREGVAEWFEAAVWNSRTPYDWDQGTTELPAGRRNSLSPHVPREHPMGMGQSVAPWRRRLPPNRSVTVAMTVLVFGLSASPFCPCRCEHEASAAVGERACHSQGGEQPVAPPARGSPCEHAGCSSIVVSLTPPEQLADLNPSVSSPSAMLAAPGASASVIHDMLGSSVSPPTLDLGPPIPAPLFTILRL